MLSSIILCMSLGTGWASGILAKRENSSTRRLRPLTSFITVWMHGSRTSPKSSSLLRYFFRTLSAESCMGVKGFLISWAMRLATSCQAAALWAFISSVRSSNTTSMPKVLLSLSRSAVTLITRVSTWPPTFTWTWLEKWRRTSSSTLSTPKAKGLRPSAEKVSL